MTDHDEARRRAVEALKTVLFERGIVDVFSATAALDAAERAMADAGWRWVPETPTLEMLQDGRRAASKARSGGVCGMTIDSQTRAECAREAAAWRAMVNAAMLGEGE